MAEHTIQELKMRQALPLDIKVRMTEQRIREWVSEYGIDGVYVSFSGGKVSWCLQLALNCVEGRWVAGWRGGGELDSQKQSGVQADSPGGAAGGPQHDSSDSSLC